MLIASSLLSMKIYNFVWIGWADAFLRCALMKEHFHRQCHLEQAQEGLKYFGNFCNLVLGSFLLPTIFIFQNSRFYFSQNDTTLLCNGKFGDLFALIRCFDWPDRSANNIEAIYLYTCLLIN